MAEIHNTADLKAIQRLERELLEVRDVLKQCSGYDPTDSLAENAEFFIKAARALADLHRELRKQHNELKKERENDKAVARTYPFAGDCWTSTVSVPQNTRETITWVDHEGRPVEYPYGSAIRGLAGSDRSASRGDEPRYPDPERADAGSQQSAASFRRPTPGPCE